MAGMKRRAKAKGSTLAVRRKERRLRAWLRDNFPNLNPDDLMDRIRPEVLAAARNGLSGVEGAAARKTSDADFSALARALTRAIAEEIAHVP